MANITLPEHDLLNQAPFAGLLKPGFANWHLAREAAANRPALWFNPTMRFLGTEAEVHAYLQREERSLPFAGGPKFLRLSFPVPGQAVEPGLTVLRTSLLEKVLVVHAFPYGPPRTFTKFPINAVTGSTRVFPSPLEIGGSFVRDESGEEFKRVEMWQRFVDPVSGWTVDARVVVRKNAGQDSVEMTEASLWVVARE